MRFVVVAVTRPEKATEPVSPPTGDDVDVEVGDRLADGVVHGDECPLRSHGPPHCGCDAPHPGEQRVGLLQIFQRVDVFGGNDEHVAGEQRSGVEEPEHPGFVENHRSGSISGDDLAEEARRHVVDDR